MSASHNCADQFKHVGFIEKFPGAARLIHDVFEVAPRHVVHDQIIEVGFGEVIGDFGQGGVIETGQHAGFAVKLLLRLTAGFQRHVGIEPDFFEGAGAAGQHHVLGFIDGAHAALPDRLRRSYSVIAERCRFLASCSSSPSATSLTDNHRVVKHVRRISCKKVPFPSWSCKKASWPASAGR